MRKAILALGLVASVVFGFCLGQCAEEKVYAQEEEPPAFGNIQERLIDEMRTHPQEVLAAIIAAAKTHMDKPTMKAFRDDVLASLGLDVPTNLSPQKANVHSTVRKVLEGNVTEEELTRILGDIVYKPEPVEP